MHLNIFLLLFFWLTLTFIYYKRVGASGSWRARVKGLTCVAREARLVGCLRSAAAGWLASRCGFALVYEAAAQPQRRGSAATQELRGGVGERMRARV